MAARGRPTPIETLDKLARLAREHVSEAEIAMRCGLSRTTVRKYLPASHPDKARAEVLSTLGFPAEAIAARLGDAAPNDQASRPAAQVPRGREPGREAPGSDVAERVPVASSLVPIRVDAKGILITRKLYGRTARCPTCKGILTEVPCRLCWNRAQRAAA